MTDLEKVKKGLDLCLTGEPSKCKDCPYDAECKEARGIGPSPLRRDALGLLNEQKHGHWKGFTQSRYFGTDDDGEPIFRDGLFYVCSECRRKSIIRYPYCPGCGAKMDEEVKQDGMC